MHALLRTLSRCLLLVMLATVFSPSFGWEAVQGMETHDDMGGMHEMHALHEAPVAHDDCDGCPGHEAPADCADTLHHCCPGHVLGHMPAGIGERFALALPESGKAVLDGQEHRFSSRIPEGLERPPRARSA